jgi:hypothetical protein
LLIPEEKNSKFQFAALNANNAGQVLRADCPCWHKKTRHLIQVLGKI